MQPMRSYDWAQLLWGQQPKGSEQPGRAGALSLPAGPQSPGGAQGAALPGPREAEAGALGRGAGPGSCSSRALKRSVPEPAGRPGRLCSGRSRWMTKITLPGGREQGTGNRG